MPVCSPTFKKNVQFVFRCCCCCFFFFKSSFVDLSRWHQSNMRNNPVYWWPLQEGPRRGGGGLHSWSFQWILCTLANQCTDSELTGQMSSIVLGFLLWSRTPKCDPSLCSLVREVWNTRIMIFLYLIVGRQRRGRRGGGPWNVKRAGENC